MARPENPDLPEGTVVHYQCELCGAKSVLSGFVMDHVCPALPDHPTPVVTRFVPQPKKRADPPLVAGPVEDATIEQEILMASANEAIAKGEVVNG